jgi:tetratricopeptide (TPR) repeat protein
MESLSIALERQLLKEIAGEKLFRFKHIKVQQALYNGLSALKRRLMHREAGEALERQSLPESEQIADSLAYHCFQAGELGKALVYGIQAAAQARAVYADQNAFYWYTFALDIMDQLGQDNVSQQQRFEVLLAREQIYDDQGARRTQMTDLMTLQDLAQALNDPAKQALVHNRRASYEYVMNRLAEATTEAQAGLIAARQAKNSILEGESLIQLAQIALHQGQCGQAGQHLQMAQKNLAETGDRRVEARSLNGLGTVYKLLNDYPQSIEYYQQALAMNQLTGNRSGQAACLSDLGDVSLKQGDYANAKSYQQQGLTICQLIGNRRGEAICLNRLSSIYTEVGYYELARSHIERAMSIRRSIEDEQGLAEDLRLLGTAIGLDTGDYATTRDHVGQALEIFQRSKNKIQAANTWLELAIALEGLDDFAKARQAYDQAQSIYAEIGNEISALDAWTGVARCLLAEGKADGARQEIKTCLEKLETNGVWGVKYPIRLYLTAYRVLQAAHDNREAMVVLQQGHTLLQDRANNIDDSDLRTSFLENVSENKELSVISMAARE